MSIKIDLAATKRDELKKKGAKAVRSSGRLPAILYGGNKQPIPLSFDRREFIKLTRGHSYENIIIELDIQDNGSSESRTAVIKEAQLDPIHYRLLHVDFFEVSMDKAIQVHVPIKFVGVAIGVKDHGGMLDAPMREILIKCLPMDMPDEIEIDITECDLGAVIHIKDIIVPEGVKVTDGPEKVVASIVSKAKSTETAAKVEQEEETVKEPEEVSKKTKE